DQQRFPRRQVQRFHAADDLLRDAAGGEQPRIDAGSGDDDQDLRDEEYRRQRDAPEVGPADVAVDEHGDDDREDRRDARRLGRREDAAVDAAEDHDRRAERPARVLGGGADRRPRGLLAYRHIAAARVDDHVDRVDQPDQQAWNDAGSEQR